MHNGLKNDLKLYILEFLARMKSAFEVCKTPRIAHLDDWDQFFGASTSNTRKCSAFIGISERADKEPYPNG